MRDWCALRGDLYYTTLGEPTLVRRRKISSGESPLKGTIRLPRIPKAITAASGYLFIVMKESNKVFMLDGELESLGYVMTMEEEGDALQDASVHNGSTTVVLLTRTFGLLVLWRAETETIVSECTVAPFSHWRFVPYTADKVCVGFGDLYGIRDDDGEEEIRKSLLLSMEHDDSAGEYLQPQAPKNSSHAEMMAKILEMFDTTDI
ncbi:hypothetical protein FOZ63_001204 [Perkinsus olseni]|uniref:Uncharacterized protein n=1 Tax=Perkinsus olseni TaxID=32597 RepID=A0A7J6S0H1_PEROL|nr:hypothetical protein FOZ63_001204 [Perkinsus olseni]